MKSINVPEAPNGYKWIFCRHRRVKNSDKVLDAHAYGWKSWAFLVRAKKK